MKLTAIILIILLLCGMLSVCAFAGGVAEGSTQETTVAPESSASADGNTFRLEWYHYIIPVVIIFVMTLVTSNSIKPLRK